MYNGLLMTYTRNKKTDEALRVFREMRLRGFEPDLANYTTLIQGLWREERIKECWQLYSEITEKGEKDEILTTLMIKICSKVSF